VVEKLEMSSAADRQLISVGAIGIVQHLLTKVASNMNRPVLDCVVYGPPVDWQRVLYVLVTVLERAVPPSLRNV